MKAPAFQLYASDFFMDTNHWKFSEIGIFFRLLLHEWVNKFLPDSNERLAIIAGCSLEEFEKYWPIISKKFKKKNGNLINLRMEKTRKEQELYYQSQKSAGRIGGLRTQENRRLASSNASSQRASENKALQSSSSSSITTNNIISDFDFLEKVKTTYSWVDFDLEMKKIDLWLSNNRGRKKTRKFILNWFSKKERPIGVEEYHGQTFVCAKCNKKFTLSECWDKTGGSRTCKECFLKERSK